MSMIFTPSAQLRLLVSGSMRLACMLLVPACFAMAPDARAEGASEIVHTLRQETELFVDVVDSVSETFVWTGTGSIIVRDPNDALVGVYSTGATVSPGIDGRYRVELDTDQPGGSWDLTVFAGANPQSGRLHALRWILDSGGYSASSSANLDLYALVPAGSSNDQTVFQIHFDGLSGFQYDIRANRTGLDGGPPGASALAASATAIEEHSLYLNPPAITTYSILTPAVANFAIAPATGGGYDFSFVTNADGTYWITVDVDGDTTFDPTSFDDVTIAGIASNGINNVFWDGRDESGNALALGNYQTQLIFAVGECHIILSDVETTFQGLRAFEVDGGLSRTGVPAYWNDTPVQPGVVLMPNAQFGLESSGPVGTHAGGLADPTIANVNAHAWGNFGAASKGDAALIDTYFWSRDDFGVDQTLMYVGVAPPPVDVPRAGAAAFAIEPLRNPSYNGRLQVRFALPSAERATLELVDVSGRRVASRDVGTLGAGRHELLLGDGHRFASGIYFVRLKQGARVATRRVTVLE